MGLLGVLGLKPRTAAPGTAVPVRSTAAPVRGTRARRDTPPRRGPAPPPDPAAAGFETARAASQAVLDTLDRHAQIGRVGSEAQAARAKLTQAQALAGKRDFGAAQTLAEEAGADALRVAKLADYWGEYAKRRANMVSMIASVDGVREPAVVDAANSLLKVADGIAAGPPAKPLDGIAALAEIRKAMRTWVDDALARIKKELAALKKKPASAGSYFAADIAALEADIKRTETALSSRDWSEAVMAMKHADALLQPTGRLVDRKAAYDTLRSKAAAALGLVSAKPALKAQTAELTRLLADADRQAAHDTMRFEAAQATLEDLQRRAGGWTAIASTVADMTTLRTRVDKARADLKKHPAAAQLSAPLAAADKWIDATDRLLKPADPGADPAPAWTQAFGALGQADAELREARELADRLGPGLGARAAAKDPADLGKIRSALKALRDAATSARGEGFANLAQEPFRLFYVAARAADEALARSDGKAALLQLDEATKQLNAASVIQVRHGQDDMALAALDKRREALAASPRAPKIKAKLDAFVAAYQAGRRQDDKHPGTSATQDAVRAAEAAAAAAEQAERDRKAFDKQAADTDVILKGVKDASLKAEVQRLRVKADADADALRFDLASAALKGIPVHIDTAEVKKLAAKSPTDPALVAAAARMMKNGGTAELDTVLKELPPGTDLRAATALAGQRFGVAFEVDGGRKPDAELKTLQAICTTLSKLPQDLKRANTSVKTIRHSNAKDADDHYDDMTASVALTHRPGDAQQEFGAKLIHGAFKQPQLPKDIDPKYRPLDDKPVDRLAWATLHELGHGLDDAQRFMSRHEEDPVYGDWKTYGADVAPIATAVAKEYGFDVTAEQRKYVLDRLLHAETQAPPRPTTPAKDGMSWEDVQVLVDFWVDTATSAEVYKNQSDCETITINKRVYHEAYPRIWVSYPAEERKKGLTGYQFRSPGEWFAELYAAYRSGKLGPSHPALVWLRQVAP